MDSTCRLCGQTALELTNAFSFVNGRFLLDMIHVIAPIRIEMSDRKPKNICEECVDIAVAAIKLRETSVNTDIAFCPKESANDTANETIEQLQQENFTKKTKVQVKYENLKQRFSVKKEKTQSITKETSVFDDSKITIRQKKTSSKTNHEQNAKKVKFQELGESIAKETSVFDDRNITIRQKKTSSKTNHEQNAKKVKFQELGEEAEKDPILKHFTSTGNLVELKCNLCESRLCSGKKVSTKILMNHMTKKHPKVKIAS